MEKGRVTDDLQTLETVVLPPVQADLSVSSRLGRGTSVIFPVLVIPEEFLCVKEDERKDSKRSVGL